MSRARETLLRSQHGGKVFLLLPSSGRNDFFSSRSPFVTITFACGTSFTGYFDVRGTWKEKQGSVQSRKGKCSCGEMPDAETKLMAGAHTPELTATNKNRPLQLSVPLFVANLGPKGHSSRCTQQKSSLNHLSAPRN